jgi:GDPmannose 4,6-dehydratase
MNIENAIAFKNPNTKCVFVSGVTGQDGSHMIDYLLKNTDYIIFGGIRRLSINNHININHLKNNKRVIFVLFDLMDTHNINKTIELLKPDYFINLAAQSFVGSSWSCAKLTWNTNSTSVLDILEAIRTFYPSCRLYQAGSSEEFGNISYSPQDEKHPLKPRSPYGASKVASRQLIKVYRESYNLYAIQGWLFNHEGTRRGEEFVTRKITKKVSSIYKSILKNDYTFKPLELGNIYSKRDWSDSEDFIDGIWKMLNQDIHVKDYNGIPNEYILSSDTIYNIKDFIEESFKYVDIIGYWENKTNDIINEKYYYKNNSNSDPILLVIINPTLFRPNDVDTLLGDSSKARKELNWKPKILFNDLVNKMMKNDLEE